MIEYTNFRQRLDAVLRTLDVKQVSEFLIAEKQWQAGQPADVEFAMWMMIAGSPTLRDLHEQARQWLVGHGHEDEANAVLRREKGSAGEQGSKKQGRGTQKRQVGSPAKHNARRSS
ncbi:MAG: hypothetical protein E6I32_06940 [Chloroflexi bacterium]|nr:MAG: hypothetical protein E6I32_06940 [Chloroflexota bacterium]